MTKEIVELPDKHTGDINEIRDKKIALAKDATAQSDLPQQLEYLIKNGQTGEFMNVLDSYINEKIRSALGSLIASLDKGAAGTTKAIACIDTNNDLGIINPANLASVLGVAHVENSDAAANYIGLYITNSGTGVGVSLEDSSQNKKYQWIFDRSQLYYRDKDGVNAWTSWVIPFPFMKIISFTVTTSGNGNVDCSFGSEVRIFTAYCTSRGGAIISFYPATGDGGARDYTRWWFHCTTDDGNLSPIASSSIIIEVIYSDLYSF